MNSSESYQIFVYLQVGLSGFMDTNSFPFLFGPHHACVSVEKCYPVLAVTRIFRFFTRLFAPAIFCTIS
jgi:hypothetical protein